MATIYRGNAHSGNWSSDDGTWVTSSGGTTHSNHPIAGDDVILDANSGNITVDANSACNSIVCTGYTGTLTITGSYTMTTSSTVTLVAGMTFTPNSSTWYHTAACTITSGGKSFTNLEFAGVAAYTATLADALDVNGTLSINFTTTSHYVTLSTSNVTCWSLSMLSGTVRGTQTITMDGTGSWTGAYAVRCPLTFNSAGTITIGTVVTTSLGCTLTYTAGTMVTTGSRLAVNHNDYLNTSGMTWNNVQLNSAKTVTLQSDLHVGGTITILGTTAFAGAFNIDTVNLTINTAATVWTITGNVTVSGTLTLGYDFGISGVFDFNCAYVTNTAAVTLTLVKNMATVTTVTLGNNLTLSGAFDFNCTNLICSASSTLTVAQKMLAGRVVLASGAVLTLANSSGSVIEISKIGNDMFGVIT